MKRITTIFLALIMMFSLVSCKSGDNGTAETASTIEDSSDVSNDATKSEDTIVPTDNENGDNPDDLGHTGVKIEGEITAASAFSEGLAFVCLDGNKDKTYCINKEGYIVFELDRDVLMLSDGNYIALDRIKFINGFALLGKGICDITGKVIQPEDVGVTTFYDNAFEGGYILAEKQTSDYSSTKKEFGVMNTSFEWIVEPSEELYNALSDSYSITVDRQCFDDEYSYYCNDVFYCHDNKVYIDLKTGVVSDSRDYKLPPEKWLRGYSGGFYDENNNVMLDLSDYDNLIDGVEGDFINGKAPLLFHNREASTYFITYIDESGNFAFDPIEVKDIRVVVPYYDGEYLLIVDSELSPSNAHCYDLGGELIGTFNASDANLSGCIFSISDGVIKLKSGGNEWKVSIFQPRFHSIILKQKASRFYALMLLLFRDFIYKKQYCRYPYGKEEIQIPKKVGTGNSSEGSDTAQ